MQAMPAQVFALDSRSALGCAALVGNDGVGGWRDLDMRAYYDNIPILSRESTISSRAKLGRVMELVLFLSCLHKYLYKLSCH